MADHPQRRSTGLVPLVQCSVLYFGSAVPLETAAGLDSFKMPLRQRYTLTDDGHLLGIDATLTVYSAGMLVRYTADQTSSAWFPIQALHICAALKAFRGPATGGGGGRGDLEFAAVDSSLAKDSRHPPIFAFINRRTKGIKVLECHMFVCNSVADATSLVQSCMNAYERKEGWIDVDPFPHASESLPKIVPADPAESKYGESGIHAGGGIRDDGLLKEGNARVPLRGFLHSNSQELIQKHNVFGYEDNDREIIGETKFQVPRAPLQEQPAFAIHRQLQYAGTDHDNARTSSAFKNSPLVAASGTPQVQYMHVVPKGYFAAGVNPYGSVPFMFVPASSFYLNENRNLKQKKKKKNKVQKSEKTTSSNSKALTKVDEENEDEIIEEYYYVQKSTIYPPTAYHHHHHQSTTAFIQDTNARWDDGLQRVTMPSHPFPPPPPASHQTGYIQNASRYADGRADHQYITRSVPNMPRTREGDLMQQRYLHGSSHDHNAITGRSDSQNALEHARTIEIANEQSNRIEQEEPIPDYPNDPAELNSDIRRYDTGFHRARQQIHRVKEDEIRYGDQSRATDRLQPLKENVSVPAERNGHCDCDKMPSTEPEGKRGYAELLGDLGYMP